MKAGVVTPGQEDSARVIEMDTPSAHRGEAIVRILEVGIDGTDMEINRGRYGESPAGYDFLVLGHEALGEIENPGATDFNKAEMVVPLVRRPDGCINCRSGQSDMCIEGNYRECGIKSAHGFLREYLVEKAEFLVVVPGDLRRVAVLTEPMSIVTKGIDQATEFHRHKANTVQVVLVLGAGPLGLLATAFLQLRGFSTHTLDIVPESSLKARLVEAIGAIYLDSRDYPLSEIPRQIGNLDLVVEATGNSTIAFQAMAALGINGVLCLMGVSTGEKPLEICADCLNMEMVLGNKVVFGTVSSNRRHFERAIQSLGEIEREWPGWLAKLITRRLPLADLKSALAPSPDNIKTVIEIP